MSLAVQSQLSLLGCALLTGIEGDSWANRTAAHAIFWQTLTERGLVVFQANDHVFFWKGSGSPPSRKSARHTRSAKDNDQKVSSVKPASILALAANISEILQQEFANAAIDEAV